jgi:hypothetical protein
MIPAKEFEGELWIKAADFHRQKKEWQGLEIDEIEAAAVLGIYKKPLIEFARAIEAKLKEKNAPHL